LGVGEELLGEELLGEGLLDEELPGEAEFGKGLLWVVVLSEVLFVVLAL
jgi:hypothetical protein